MKIHPYFRVLPRARLYLATRPRAGCIGRAALVVALLLLVARVLTAQVSAVVPLHGRDAEVRVGNPTLKPLRVTLVLYRDRVGSNPPLGDSVPARISPRAFTLQPGAEQMVRLRLPSAPPSGTILRLAVTFTPPDDRTTGMQLVLAVRYIVRVEAGP
jgi:P pilus assembly chaperone PapD